MHVITLTRIKKVCSAELDINHNLVKHDGARPHDEEGNGHTGCDDNKVAKGVVFFNNSLNSNTSAMSNVLAHSTNAGKPY